MFRSFLLCILTEENKIGSTSSDFDYDAMVHSFILHMINGQFYFALSMCHPMFWRYVKIHLELMISGMCDAFKFDVSCAIDRVIT